MTTIQFDVLIPADPAQRLRENYELACDKLVKSNMLDSATLTFDDAPNVADGVVEQLHRIYEQEHNDDELEDGAMHRYRFHVDGVKGSVNQLTMALSRFLTPEAPLPSDRVLLEDEQAYEQPAIYPWTVNVFR